MPGAARNRSDAEGKVLLDSRTLPAPPGDGATLWSGPLGPHSVRNVGERELHVIAVELTAGSAG